MGHLAKPRKGWENQHLAASILSKFSFIAQPSTVGDDIGTDYFCTIFHPIEKNGQKLLIPENSFAIQVKSNTNRFRFAHLEYLWDLEIPFFVGVVDQQRATLTIYSGEYIPALLSLKGHPERLEIELCETLILSQYFTESGNKRYVLRFPKITQISQDIQPQDLHQKVQELRARCHFMLRNIAARRSKEYTFFYPSHLVRFAGRDSVRVFQQNFLTRLAEVAFNLDWLYKNLGGDLEDARSAIIREFEVYEAFLKQLENLYGELPDLRKLFRNLRASIDAGAS